MNPAARGLVVEMCVIHFFAKPCVENQLFVNRGAVSGEGVKDYMHHKDTATPPE